MSDTVSLGLYRGKLYLVRSQDCIGNPGLAELVARDLVARVGPKHPLKGELEVIVSMYARRVPGDPVVHPHGPAGSFLRTYADKVVTLRAVTAEDDVAVWVLCRMWGELPDVDREGMHDWVVRNILTPEAVQRDRVVRAMLGRDIGNGVAKLPYELLLIGDKGKRPNEFRSNKGVD